MRPLVTIITPSLNQGAFIEHTIRSVLAQDYEPIEYLVYDAGSSDNTHEVLRSYADRLRTVIAADGGQADAINRGLRSAKGEIVSWLNSDDLYLPGAVASAVAYLTDHPRCAMVYGDADYIDAAGRRIGRYPTAPVSRLTEGCYICQPATFMRREAVAAVGSLDPSLRFCMDYDLWLRLGSRYELGYLPTPLACSRLHPGAKTVTETLAFHREVVCMTARRLGAAPLPWLYGYADLLAQEHLKVSRRLPRALAAGVLTIGLAFRHHRRVRASDLRLVWQRLRPAGTLDPSNP